MDIQKQFKQILFAVIKSILHLFKIHREVIFGNPAVVVEDMLGKPIIWYLDGKKKEAIVLLGYTIDFLIVIASFFVSII